MKHHIPSLNIGGIEMFCARVVQREKKWMHEKNADQLMLFIVFVFISIILIVPPVYRKTEILHSADKYYFNHPALKQLAIGYKNADWRLF